MNYTLKGTLYAMNWGDCKESLPNVMVKLYDVKDRPNLKDMLSEKEKNILVVDSDNVLEDKKRFFLGETLTDDNGNFKLTLSGSEYQGKAFEVAIYCETIPGLKKAASKPIEFVIATIEPEWDKTSKTLVFEWNYCLPFGFWRYILSLFDVWVIYGKIISSKKHRKPIIGVEVTAKDADWISENELGFSITDNSGHFKIYYTSREFMKPGVSPDKFEEILSPNIYSGPDVYFTVKTVGGIALIDETKNDGRKPERSNIGNCYCITLSVIHGQEGEINGMDSAWKGIGETFAIPAGEDLNSFDSEGYAGVMKYAITGNIRLTGQKVNKVGPHPLEYRFLICKSTGMNGSNPLPVSNFSMIVGKTPGLFVETKVGQMWQFYPTFRIVNIYAKQIDIDNDGWLDVNRSIERTFAQDASLDPSELAIPNLWQWVDFGGMVAINTDTLKLTDNLNAINIEPGDGIEFLDRLPIEKIAIRFEIREVIDKVKEIYNYLPASGLTLNSLVVSNNDTLKLIAIKEHLNRDPGEPFSGDVHVVYTAYHPHLLDVCINVRKNNENNWNGFSDLTVPLACNNNPGINLCCNSNGFAIPQYLIDSSGSYSVMMYITRRLHNGDEAVPTEWVDTAFNYQKQPISAKQLWNTRPEVLIAS